LREVAAALSVAPWNLYRSTRTDDNRERFHEVRAVAAQPRAPAVAPVMIMTADGLLVEGLDINGAAQWLRLLP
jgi:hypothetical protein